MKREILFYKLYEFSTFFKAKKTHEPEINCLLNSYTDVKFI